MMESIKEQGNRPAALTVEMERPRPRILWINCRLLHPLIGGDRLRTYHMLRILKEWFEITYFCPRVADDTAEAVKLAAEYSDSCATYPHRFPPKGSPRFFAEVIANCISGSVPYMAKKYRSKRAHEWLEKTLTETRYDLVVCDYLVSLVHLMDLHLPKMPPVLVFQHNVESLIWQRHVAAAGNPVKRMIFRRERDLTLRMEDQCATLAAGQVTVSPLETQHFRDERGMRNVLGSVPTGVDCDHFQPTPETTEPYTMAFLGSMDWEANVLAVQGFITESLPAIKQRFPEAKFLVIGRNPPEWLREQSAKDPSIEVTGTVDDVRPYLARAAIMVLPLTVGGGTRIKVFEAMAAGLAVVSTPTGVEGLPVVHEEHAWISESGTPFTEGILHLLSKPEARQTMARRGRELVEAEFGWRKAAEIFRDYCMEIIPDAVPR
jgi:glycosyltransferase involved in cell wall biosynthesis